MYCNGGLHINSDSESVSQDPALKRSRNIERYQMDGI